LFIVTSAIIVMTGKLNGSSYSHRTLIAFAYIFLSTGYLFLFMSRRWDAVLSHALSENKLKALQNKINALESRLSLPHTTYSITRETSIPGLPTNNSE
jgi:hypothetical protein